MKANEVIITARNRIFDPSTAASLISMPFSRWSFANSTIRMPFLADMATRTTRPICAYRSSERCQMRMPINAPKTPTGTDKSTGTGTIQLS
jgi:hypothetical protein